MANPPKPWKAEYAKSSRSSCKTCKSPIEKEKFRLGKMVQATQFDGFMPVIPHSPLFVCLLRFPPFSFSIFLFIFPFCVAGLGFFISHVVSCLCLGFEWFV